MRILIASLALLSLASCTFPGMGKDTMPISTGTTDTTSGATVEKVAPTAVADGTYVTVNYTLRDGAADGKILETTLYSVAQANSITGSEDSFKPFSVMMGAKQLIPGFENGLMGMKKGDKKTIEVPPELGYGTGPVLSTIAKFNLAPVFTITQDKKIFADMITEVVQIADLPEDMKSAKIGQVFTGANNSTAKVTAVDTTSITLQINNTNNPYYGKKIVVGATAENETKDATFKIVKMEGTGVTLEVTNKKSPFYNKKFAVGESIDTQNGKTEIREITDESLVIAQYHPMVGKTLFFDVEVVEIK
jgi:FKBP-type peptidyl-prolyl cis-trans isomerase 2